MVGTAQTRLCPSYAWRRIMFVISNCRDQKSGERNMQQDLRIGEVASRTGRSVHTIRWYESQGLLPGVARDGSDRRIYSEYHVGWLGLIDRLRYTCISCRQ